MNQEKEILPADAPECESDQQNLQQLVEQLLTQPTAQALLKQLQNIRYIEETSQCSATILNGPSAPVIEPQEMKNAQFLVSLDLIQLNPRGKTYHYLGGVLGVTPRQRTTFVYDAASITPLGFQVLDVLRAAEGQKPYRETVEEGRRRAAERARTMLKDLLPPAMPEEQKE